MDQLISKNINQQFQDTSISHQIHNQICKFSNNPENCIQQFKEFTKSHIHVKKDVELLENSLACFETDCKHSITCYEQKCILPQ
jgi:hypothetical protein